MFPAGWTLDGNVVWTSDSAEPMDQTGIHIADRNSTRSARHIYPGQLIRAARVCPSRTRIAFVSAASGRPEVYLDSFPATGAQPLRISRNGGGQPRWRADGRELFFVDGQSMWTVSVDAAPNISVGTPARLFASDVPLSGPIAYEPAADGLRFLMLENRTADSFSVKVTLNWAAGVGRAALGL